MRTIIFFIIFSILSTGIYATKFSPIRSEKKVTMPFYQSSGRIIGTYEDMVSDVTIFWWDSYVEKISADILFDTQYYCVLKKKNKTIVVFNTGKETFCIYGAKIGSNRNEYFFEKNLIVYLDKITSKNSEKIFEVIKKNFKSKKIEKLTVKNFESYFK